MPYKLNGINYTEMLLTDEELAVVKAMRNKTDGCLKCEGGERIKSGNFEVFLEEDAIDVDFNLDEQNIRHEEYISIQISYCPFCGSKLDAKKSN